MLTVPVHKDFTEYKAKWIGGMTLRTIVCITVALSCSAAFSAVCILALGIDPGTVSYAVWIVALPAALIGFYRPHGMDFEKFVPLWWRHTMEPQLVLYVSADHRGAAAAREKARRDMRAEELSRVRCKPLERALARPGAESWEPGGELPRSGDGISPVAAFWSDGAGSAPANGE